jgi:hypothetical protein
MSYRNHTFFFRYVPNPGFHEGVADIMSLVAGKCFQFAFIRGDQVNQVLNDDFKASLLIIRALDTFIIPHYYSSFLILFI